MESTKITEKQLNSINEELEQVVEENDNLKNIAQFPSNNNVEYHNPEEGKAKKVKIMVNPETGEHSPIGVVSSEDKEETFEEMIERLEKESDFNSVNEKPIELDELGSLISRSKTDPNSILRDITTINNNNFEISDDSLKIILQIANRKMKKEEFNVYREFPDEVKSMINKYCAASGVSILTNQGKNLRNMVSELLISEFISNITMDRVQIDFNKEIETLFSKGNEEIAEAAIGYTTEKNEAMRKYALEKMQDGEKKDTLLTVLDNFDDAYSLTSMKEFAKKCKIKKYDLERPDKIYDNFLRKYVNSTYNIWDIKIVRPILARNLNTETEEFTEKDIDAFFICYCKQCLNMKPEIAQNHAYMYNIIYNITLIDINKGKTKEVSDTFINNIREVIYNLRVRNNNYLYA